MQAKSLPDESLDSISHHGVADLAAHGDTESRRTVFSLQPNDDEGPSPTTTATSLNLEKLPTPP